MLKVLCLFFGKGCFMDRKQKKLESQIKYELRRINRYRKKYIRKGIHFDLDLPKTYFKHEYYLEQLKKLKGKELQRHAYYTVKNTGERLTGLKAIRFVNQQAVSIDVINLFREQIQEQCHWKRIDMALADWDNWITKMLSEVGEDAVAQALYKAIDEGNIINPDLFYREYVFKLYLANLTKDSVLYGLKDTNMEFTEEDALRIEDYSEVLREQGLIDKEKTSKIRKRVK